MKTSKKKSAKYNQIIEAAVRVFSKKGYHNTKMEEIAVAAQIGKGTIYEYFDSKLHLFQEMLEKSINMYYESLRVNRDHLSVADRIQIIMESHIRFLQEQKELTRLVFWDIDIFDEDLKKWGQAIHRDKEKRLKKLIVEGIERGEFRNIDPTLATLAIMGILGSLWAPITLEEWDVDPADLARKVTDIVLHGIT
ncbi:MAG: TetR/AcrR family transcriptional regulator [Syntrophomonadaceae bacterium]|jgi:AcrR family transcriptional regulator